VEVNPRNRSADILEILRLNGHIAAMQAIARMNEKGLQLTAARTGEHIFHRVDTTRCLRPFRVR
jgi:hypothetical protein